MNFKNFIINEDKSYLADKLSSILNALHDLIQDQKNIGNRKLTSYSENIVNKIRNVLHTSWKKDNQKYLMPLQKVGVSIMKAIDEKGDLENLLKISANIVEKILEDMGEPQNRLGE